MVIWKGFGFLNLVIVVVIGVIANWALTTAGIESFPENTPVAIACFLSSPIVWFLGKKMNANSPKVLVDPETGTQYRMGTLHTLFFIPMQYWGLIFIVAGIGYTILLFY